jgi:hypothetical protein
MNTQEALREIESDPSAYIRARKSPNSAELTHLFTYHPNPVVRAAAILNPRSVLYYNEAARFARDESELVRVAVLSTRAATHGLVRLVWEHPEKTLLSDAAIAASSHAPDLYLYELGARGDWFLRNILCGNPTTPQEMLVSWAQLNSEKIYAPDSIEMIARRALNKRGAIP